MVAGIGTLQLNVGLLWWEPCTSHIHEVYLC